ASRLHRGLALWLFHHRVRVLLGRELPASRGRGPARIVAENAWDRVLTGDESPPYGSGPRPSPSPEIADLTPAPQGGLPPMDYTRLGNTGLEVSRICLGCMSFGDPKAGTHPWTLDEEQSRPIIRAAWEAGINF